MLHYVTPNQIWDLPNPIISEFFDDLLSNNLNIEKVMRTVNTNDLSFFRRFWSLATVRDPNKSSGQLPENGLAKSGTYVYIGPADNQKPSFKLLDLATLQTFESAHVILNEEVQHTKDLLTNFDKIGSSNLSRPSTARQIRNSFRSTEDVPPDFLAKEENSESELPNKFGPHLIVPGLFLLRVSRG